MDVALEADDDRKPPFSGHTCQQQLGIELAVQDFDWYRQASVGLSRQGVSLL
jgi:hypothetical protein